MGETAGAQLHVTSDTWDQPDTWKKPEWYTATGATRPRTSSRFRFLAALPFSLTLKKPEWYTATGARDRLKHYTDHRRQQIRTRFAELEAEFRVCLSEPEGRNSSLIGKSLFDHLVTARQTLEGKLTEDLGPLENASANLDEVERYLVWLWPREGLQARNRSVRIQLANVRPAGFEKYQALLDEHQTTLVSDRAPDPLPERAALAEAIVACHKYIVESTLNSGLQIRRLYHLVVGGSIAMVTLLVLGPLAMNDQSKQHWPMTNLLPAFLIPWFATLIIALVGAVAAFLSALLQARDSSVSVTDYQKSLKLIELRPLVGGIVAVILSILLSWNLIPTIAVESAGTFLLVAFIAGFSERYFLKLLNINEGT